jgi:undecaprenyl-diphosphatase
LIAVGLWAFAEIADEVTEGESHAFDESVLRALREADDPADPIGPIWLEEAGRDITALGGIPVLALVTFGVSGFLWLSGKTHAMWSVLAAVVSGTCLSYGLKFAFARPRPDLVPHLSQVYSSSFPSGHAMMSAVVYLTLGSLLAAVIHERRAKLYVISAAVVLTLLIGVSRVYLGVHYPTDVLAGWSVGLAWALLCRMVVGWLQRHGAVES